MKHLRTIGVIVVLANIVVLAWLMLAREEGSQPQNLDQVLKPLVADSTMEAARYDLSGRDSLNVILISMDALRYDRTGLSGNTDGLTTNLDQFAEESVVFHDATSAAPWTLPSNMSIWTSRWPTVHGVTNKLRLLSHDQLADASLSPGIQTFPDALIAEGWTAAGFTGGAGVQGMYGFSRGFETYLDDRYFGGLDYSIPAAIEWVRDSQEKRPFFLFLHGYDSHGQYDLPESERSSIPYEGKLDGSIEEQAQLREQGLANLAEPGSKATLSETIGPSDTEYLTAIYDRKVRAADQRLGGFLTQLKTMGLLDNSIVAIVSDHGDELMEHDGLDHGYSLYQEQLHVVMMVRFPGYARRHDVNDPVRTIDLFPTLFDAMAIKGPGGVDGVSLLPLLQGQPYKAPVFAETDYRLFVHQRSLRQGQYKMILDLKKGSKELYDLSADPTEMNDISSSEPRRTYEMEQEIRTWLGTMGTNPQDYLGIEQKPITLF